MKAGLYKRISTGEQSNYSLEAQEEQLKNYCISNDISIYKIYEDQKGRFTFEERNGLMKLLDDIEKNKINCVLVTELDRLSGDEGILGYIKYTLKKNSSILISINEQNKVRNEYQELIDSILTAVAKFENRRKKLRCRRGIMKARKEGKTLNRVPLGYTIKDKGKNTSKVIIDNVGKDIVIDIFNRYANQKQSMYKISKELSISKSKIRYILRNRFYADDSFNGKHTPIISKRMYNKANNISR